MFEGKMLKKMLMVFAVLAGSSGIALADDCQVQITQPVVDYGDLNPAVLRASAKSSPTVALGKRTMQLNILCSDVKDMALTFHGIASGLQSYQISDKGEFDLTLKDARLDGEPVLLGLISSVGESAGDSSRSVMLIPEHYVVPMLDQQVKLGKALSLKLEVDARLFVSELKIRDVAMLEGLGQFDLN